MQRLDTYPLPPGCCAFCRGNALPTVDLDINTDDLPVELAIEQSGWAYMCVNCVYEAGRLMGMVPRDEADVLRARLNTLNAEYAATRDRLAAAEAGIVSMTRAGYTPAEPEVASA